MSAMKHGDNLECAMQTGTSIAPGDAAKPAGRKITTKHGKRDPGSLPLKLVTEGWEP